MSGNIFVWLLTTVLLGTVSARAQQLKKIPRVGVLFSAVPSTYAARDSEFRRGLRDLGYIEEQSIFIDYRYGEGKLARLPELAAELIRLDVDVMAAGGISPSVPSRK